MLTAATIVLAAFAAISSVSGCGGGSGSSSLSPGDSLTGTPATAGTGRAVFTVLWPVPETTRLIPAAAASITVTILNGAGETVAERIIDRPAATAEFSGLPVGSYVARAAARPGAGGVGTPQAIGNVALDIRAGETSRVGLSMGSTITSVTITPPSPSLTVGQAVTVSGAAYDAGGNVVLVAPVAQQWQSSRPEIASVDSSGVIAAVSPGQAEIRFTDTESGNTAVTPITVTPRPERYTITDIGVFSGDTLSVAFDVNNAGQVVGSSFRNSSSNSKGFFWRSQSEGLKLLEGTDGWALDINESGQIAGRADKSSVNSAVLWENFNSNSEELFYTNSSSKKDNHPGYAAALNNSGQISGWNIVFDDAAYWENKLSLPRDIKQVSARSYSAVLAMNDAGLTVGYASETNLLNDFHASLWRRNGSGTGFDEILISTAATKSIAFGINESGQVVGTYGNKAFLWREGSTLIELPTLGGSANVDAQFSAEVLDGYDRVCAAFDINESGVIVGDSTLLNNTRHACIWRKDSATGAYQLTDLNDLIDPASGWVLESAKAINDSGTIVGYGRLRGGNIRAFLITPN